VFSTLVAISCFGALNGSFYTSKCTTNRLDLINSRTSHLRCVTRPLPPLDLCPTEPQASHTRLCHGSERRVDDLLRHFRRRIQE
jgi:hypothetical protein